MNRNAFFAWLMLLVAVVCSALPAAAAVVDPSKAPEGFNLVAYDDCGRADRDSHRVAGQDWTYPASDVPLSVAGKDDPARTVSFDAKDVVYRYAGLPADAKYKIRVTYLQEAVGRDRVQTLRAGGVELHGELALPKGKVEVHQFDIPAQAIQDGKLELHFGHVAGPNAVVSKIELWSTAVSLPQVAVQAASLVAGEVSGTVTDPVYRGVEGAEVVIAAGQGQPTLSAVTGKDGTFTFALGEAWRKLARETATISAAKGTMKGQMTLVLQDVFPVQPRLTPRPATVGGVKDLTVDLTGPWKFNPQPGEGFAAADFKDGGWAAIQVPGEWVLQGFAVKAGTPAGYRRAFAVPADWAGKRIKLRCDSVYSDARVYVNGKPAGSHMGGFTLFELDVTDLVKVGGQNVLALAVTCESIADALATGSGYAKHPIGGILRKMYLLAVPEVYISRLHVETDLDRDYKDATLKVFLGVTNEGAKECQGAEVAFSLAGPGQKGDAIAPLSVKLPAIPAGATLEKVIEIPVADPPKWEAEHPLLHTLEARLLVGGSTLEEARRRVGFRQIEVRANRMYVNGKPVQLLGTCRHDVHPILGRAVDPRLSRKDAELFKAANMNFIRTSHYPPDEALLDACDELGIYVTLEGPFCWAPHSTDPKFRTYFVTPAAEMLERDRSHPSIVIWSLGNESGWGSNFKAELDYIQKTDPSRATIFSDGGGFAGEPKLSVISLHYPGPGGPARVAGAPKPAIFDEYCHLNCYNPAENTADPGVRDYYGLAIAPMVDSMRKSPGCLGGSIWAGIDEVFILKDGQRIGYGEWGPIDGWRRTKPEYWHVKKAYSPVRLSDQAVEQGGKILLDVENRYVFTNLRELQIQWSLGEEKGTAQADVPPQSKGKIAIAPQAKDVAGKLLTVQVMHPTGYLASGYLVDACVYAIGPAVPPQPVIEAGGKATLEQTDDAITVKGGGSTWVFDARTGLIRRGEVGGKTVVVGGPVLAISPLGGGNPAGLAGWKAQKVQAQTKDNAVIVTVQGAYAEAAGTFEMTVGGGGQLGLAYHFDYTGGGVNPRETGVMLHVAPACDTLNWKRHAQWSWYPDDHIGRPHGTARAFRDASWPKIDAWTQPPWPWSLDSTAEGTNDFRGTKYRFLRASLSGGGAGVEFESDGRQAFRSWVAKDNIHALVAGYINGGGEGFLNAHYAASRRPIKKGDKISDSVKLSLRAQ